MMSAFHIRVLASRELSLVPAAAGRCFYLHMLDSNESQSALPNPFKYAPMNSLLPAQAFISIVTR